MEEIEGDLLQRYERDTKKFGERRAKRRMLWNTARFLRPGIIFRNQFSLKFNSMIGHYFTLSWRSILRNKVFSAINIVGLTVGLVAFFLIIQYVSYEFGFDRFHDDYKRLYRVVHQQEKNGEVVSSSATTYIGMRQLIRENFPGVKATGFSELPIDFGLTFGVNGKPHWEPGEVIQADTAFFDVFSGILLKGNPSTALNAGGIVLSEKIATNLFGEGDALHQRLDDIADLNQTSSSAFDVSGIMMDLPPESHLHFEGIIPTDESWDTTKYFWETVTMHTYVRVPENTDVKDFEARLNTLLEQVAVDFPNVKGSHAKLQAITDIHLQPGLSEELEPRTNGMLPIILSIIAFSILFIAWINYINLETARFVTQAKEVGIRRVIGSSRRELTMQFVTRYFCLNLVAFTLALATIWLLIPYLSYVTGIPVTNINFTHRETWIAALLFYVAGSVLAGVYPVLLLLKLNPAAIVKGTAATGYSGRLKTSLVVMQYVTSIALIIFVAIANQQLDFMKLIDKKLDVEHVVAIENPLAYTEAFDGLNEFPTLRNALKAHPAINEVTVSSNVPGRAINFSMINEIKRKQNDPHDPRRFKLLFIDYNYIPLYGLKLKAGRNYLESEGAEDNSGRTILNEAAVRALGFNSAEEAINQKIYFRIWEFMKPEIEIVGILEDHHHQAIKEEVEPTVYFLNMGRFQQAYFSVKLNTGADTHEAMAFVEATFRKTFPKNPFHYFFVDEIYDKQFESEVHFARIFTLFSWVASFLACLGILGITLFETNTRLKEISIRKVLGASVSGIITLLSKKYVRVVIASLVIAVPLAYYGAAQWLLNYPVRTDLTMKPFIISAVTIVLITFVASGVQTFKAARSNPVDHLKNE